jgi:coenzyme PQQ precursor peptide PqqA
LSGKELYASAFRQTRLRDAGRALRFAGGVGFARRVSSEDEMAWKAPKIVEVPVGMEINMYVCATRK